MFERSDLPAAPYPFDHVRAAAESNCPGEYLAGGSVVARAT